MVWFGHGKGGPGGESGAGQPARGCGAGKSAREPGKGAGPSGSGAGNAAREPGKGARRGRHIGGKGARRGAGKSARVAAALMGLNREVIDSIMDCFGASPTDQSNGIAVSCRHLNLAWRRMLRRVILDLMPSGQALSSLDAADVRDVLSLP